MNYREQVAQALANNLEPSNEVMEGLLKEIRERIKFKLFMLKLTNNA
jgi:hypothetical protein